MTRRPSMYTELAPWWPLLSDPAEYAGEAAAAWQMMTEGRGAPPRQVLELGAGGGNNASHLKARCQMTLTDLSPEMLAVSRGLNPECEHALGDMRTLRLGRIFDAVLIHDAICYMVTEEDLRAALTTARAHLGPGGVLVVMPDEVEETYEPSTDDGGHDAPDGRALRYLEWAHPQAPGSSVVQVDYVLVTREVDGSTWCVHDRHLNGVFPRETWRRLLLEVGFSSVEIHEDAWRCDNFVARV